MRRPTSTPSKPRRSRCSLPVLLLGVTVIFQTCLAIAWARIKTSDSSSDGGAAPIIGANKKPRIKPPSTIALTLRVDQVVVHKLRPSPCVTMDWWPASKCDYGVCPWKNASVLTADLNDPLLVGAVKALSPVALRVGGSLADQIRYASIPHHSSEVSRKPCDATESLIVDHGVRVGFRGGCLPFARWLELLEFCTLAGCHLLFSVNALRGRQREECPSGTLCRTTSLNGASSIAAAAAVPPPPPPPPRPTCCSNYNSGSWDPSNLRDFLKATAASGHRPAGLAFGNELVTDKGIEAHLPAKGYAHDVKRFASLVRTVWPSKPPLLIAPDMNHVDEMWLTEFLTTLWPPAPPPPPPSSHRSWFGANEKESDDDDDEGKPPPPIDLISHHMYPLGAGDEANLRSKLLDPRRLDQGIHDRLRTIARIVTNHTHGQAHLCVSETGGAYNSGQSGVTDSFASLFWWLDLLGALGKHGHDFACRQTLIGGRYGLVDLHTRQPNPDFWALLLWRRLISPKALRLLRFTPKPAASANNATKPTTSFLRAYAACARSNEMGLNVLGGVVLLLINLSSESTHHIMVELQHQNSTSTGGTTTTTEVNLTFTPRYDYVLTADSLRSRSVKLNGVTLQALPDGSIPSFEGEVHAGRNVKVPPLSASFHVFPEASNGACFTQKQQIERDREMKKEQRPKGRRGGRRARSAAAADRAADAAADRAADAAADARGDPEF